MSLGFSGLILYICDIIFLCYNSRVAIEEEIPSTNQSNLLAGLEPVIGTFATDIICREATLNGSDPRANLLRAVKRQIYIDQGIRSGRIERVLLEKNGRVTELVEVKRK